MALRGEKIFQIKKLTYLSGFIGNTPLLKLDPDHWGTGAVDVYAKAEWFNLGGSVKARPVLRMISDAIQKDQLHEGMTLLDATSGNTGIAIAMIAAALGYKSELIMPRNVSQERISILKAYGANVVLTDPIGGTEETRKVAKEKHQSDPNHYYYLDQFNNPANWKAHYETTGNELIKELGSNMSHFVACIGTGGTLVGTSRRLKDYNSSIKVVAVQPDSTLHGIEGIRYLDLTKKQGIFDPSCKDLTFNITTEHAQTYTKLLAEKEGLLVGTSSGAALAACLNLARDLKRGTIVTVFPDSGEKYLSDKYWDEE
jgi:cysteine synthase B